MTRQRIDKEEVRKLARQVNKLVRAMKQDNPPQHTTKQRCNCPDCVKKREYFKAYARENSYRLYKAVRKSLLKRKYNMTLEDFERMKAAQHGVCASCGKPETVKYASGKIRELAVDYDYEKNTPIRLICARCDFTFKHMVRFFENLPEETIPPGRNPRPFKYPAQKK